MIVTLLSWTAAVVVSLHLNRIVAQLDRSVYGLQDASMALPPGQDLKAGWLQCVQADVQGGEAWGMERPGGRRENSQ